MAKTCNPAYESHIRELVAHQLHTEALALTPIPTYLDTIVYEIQTSTGTFIFKALDPASRDPDGIALEAWMCTTLAAANVPAPHVVTLDTSGAIFPGVYLLMEKARGQPLSTLALAHDDKRRVYAQVGSALHRMHAIQVPGFGWLDEDRYRSSGQVVGSASTWSEALFTRVPAGIAYLAAHGGITPDEVTALDGVVTTMTTYVAAVQDGRLLHGDLGPLHVWVDPVTLELTSLIDFGERMAGDPLWEFIDYDWDDVRTLWAAYAPAAEPSPIFGPVFYGYAVLRAIPWAHKWYARGAAHVLDWLRITLTRATDAMHGDA